MHIVTITFNGNVNNHKYNIHSNRYNHNLYIYLYIFIYMQQRFVAICFFFLLKKKNTLNMPEKADVAFPCILYIACLQACAGVRARACACVRACVRFCLYLPLLRTHACVVSIYLNMAAQINGHPNYAQQSQKYAICLLLRSISTGKPLTRKSIIENQEEEKKIARVPKANIELPVEFEYSMHTLACFCNNFHQFHHICV